MPEINVTKRFRFEAAHFLPGYPGDCANIHGHSYLLEVTFGVSADYEAPIAGMVVDFKDVKQTVQPIVDRLDHAYLNDLLDMPTAEALVYFIRFELAKTALGQAVTKIRLWETNDSYATWEA